jgi:transposase-like protein
MSTNEKQQGKVEMPSLERIQEALGSAQSIDDFFGKEGIFARLFASTLEQMLEAELTAKLGYEKYEAKDAQREQPAEAPQGTQFVARKWRCREIATGNLSRNCCTNYETSSNELEDKIITLYAKGLSVRDIHDSLQEMYGLDVSPSTISTITEKVLPLVEAWQSRRLEAVYPLLYLDAIYVRVGHNYISISFDEPI